MYIAALFHLHITRNNTGLYPKNHITGNFSSLAILYNINKCLKRSCFEICCYWTGWRYIPFKTKGSVRQFDSNYEFLNQYDQSKCV